MTKAKCLLSGDQLLTLSVPCPPLKRRMSACWLPSGLHTAQYHVLVLRVPLRSGRETQIHHPLAVRRDVREPIHSFVVGELLDAAAVRLHPVALRVAGNFGIQLEVEVDPVSIGRILGAIVRGGSIGQTRVRPARRRNRVDVDSAPGVVADRFHADIGQHLAVGRHAMKVVLELPLPRMIVGNPACVAACKGHGKEVSVGAKVNGLAIGGENVIVVGPFHPDGGNLFGLRAPPAGMCQRKPLELKTSHLPSGDQLGASMRWLVW